MHGEQAVFRFAQRLRVTHPPRQGKRCLGSPFRDNALAFLLDSMSDAANLWGPEGELLYRNRAAEQLGIGRCDDTAVEVLTIYGRRFEPLRASARASKNVRFRCSVRRRRPDLKRRNRAHLSCFAA